jgi:16S rRNA (cytosine967-C5)-methyltransferase
MTPAARYSAGIDILDRIASGEAAEKVLTNWARRNRYAGSGDRAAIRDIVFDILRKRRSCAAAGGAETGRALVLGSLRQSDQLPDDIFTGLGYAPQVLTQEERAFSSPPSEWSRAVRLDYPQWLEGELATSLGENLDSTAQLLRERAKVFVRVNARKTTVGKVIDALAHEQITAVPHALATYALEITENARRIKTSETYQSGLIELQDVASQAIVAAMPIPESGRILDYCAGGGGKSLAIGAITDCDLIAHDAFRERMIDLPARAKRAGVKIRQIETNQIERNAPFEMVVCDVPCSGSGAWRRNPAAKWDLDQGKLNTLLKLQQEIISEAAKHVAPDGSLVYATCSLFAVENFMQVDGFLKSNPMFTLQSQQQFTPLDGGDGLYIACLRRV